MAGISVSSGGGKRAVDHEIPLVPFIDLLLCCIMFLLVAAVWNQLATFESTLPEEPHSLVSPPPTTPSVPAIVRISADAVVVGTTEGVRVDVPAPGGSLDSAALLAALAPFEHDRPVIVSADDGVSYARLIEAMDLVAEAGLSQMSVGDSSL